jgi:aldose 1-epimerase
MGKIFMYIAVGIVVLMVSCNRKSENGTTATTDSAVHEHKKDTMMEQHAFGTLPDGQVVTRYTLRNKNGVEMEVINYGGIIASLKVPDKSGVKEDVVLGFDSLSGYLNGSPYIGAVVGRYGNRIAKGKFKLDGKEYTLAQNNNGEHLHGGVKGFDKVFWNIERVSSADGASLRLHYQSKDGEEGYPGNLSVEVLYTLTDNNELHVKYKATTDKATVVNLTQHSYFNLTGNAKRDILDHQLTIKANYFVTVGKTLIPKGHLEKVDGTPFDFNKPTAIGSRINDKDGQLEAGGGYDHCWVLTEKDSMKWAASLYEPMSGRYMEVLTTEPGIQFYSGNFLDGSLIGKGGVRYAKRFGLCLETEHFPDSPNQPSFPSVVLKPGEVYRTETVYRFSVK